MNKQLEVYKNYLINIKRSQVYVNFLIPLFDYLEEKNLQFETLTKEQLAEYFTIKNYSSNSINNVIKSCRDYAKFIKIEKHASTEIRMLEIARKEIEVIDLKDIEKVVRSIATYNSRLNADKIEIILLLMFYTIIRKSELLSLKRENIDLVNGEMKIYEQKTKQENIIDFPLSLISKLVAYFNSEPEKDNAFNITFAEINYLFREVMTKVLGKKCKPHLTRHDGIRYLLSKIPPQDVQSMAGHKDIRTTLQYGTVNREERKKTYRQKIG
jgi:integrase